MYRAAGLQVVPSHLPSEHQNWKRPALADWKSLQEELVPQSTFDRWYSAQGEHARRPNMGLLTGRASGNIFVIDLDEYKTPDALAWWQGVLAEHNSRIEPETCQQVTGGGGRQLFFVAPEGWQAPTNKTPIGVDIRGQGGFAVLPPSRHISGQPYAWKVGAAPWECEIAAAPDWLLQEVYELVERFGGDQHRTSNPVEKTNTSSPAADMDAFGARVDGRDHYMRDLIWAAVTNWYRECPIPPTDAQAQERMREVWTVYERKTKTRLSGDNTAGLEREGRGPTAFAEKWRRAMSKWGTDIAEAAQRPLARDEWREATAAPAEPAAAASAAEESQPIDVGELAGEPRPREWIVQDWIPKGVVSSLSGDGGMGKTLLAQQLLYAAGLGEKWLGLDVPATRGLGVFCEDDEDELHRRHNSIKADLGHAVGNPFTDTWIWPRVGHDNLLVTFDKDNKPLISPFFGQIMRHTMEKRIGLLVLDTIADLFGGNEIIRAQVNYFIKAVCGSLIKQAKDAGFVLTVILLSHPSQAGRNSGSGESGSTAWNNAVRARLYLTRPEDGLPEQRVLTRKKSNYSASGDDVKLDLIWSEGVLKPAANAKVSSIAIASVENQIIQMVERAWDDCRPYKAKKGPRYLDAAMVDFFGSRVDKGVIITALSSLKSQEKIVVDRVGDRRGYRVASHENGN
jgi:RecA-family ATPase